MTRRGDEVKVGVVVMATGVILITTIFLMMHYNPFQTSSDQYTIHLRFAGGLENDSIVRFGGMKRGKVVAVRLAPARDTAVEVTLRVQAGTPIRTDSVARIASLNALGENYIEISPGKEGSPLMKPGQVIRSEESPEFSELLAKINGLSDNAKTLITDLNKNINQISSGTNTLLGNLNDITGTANRQSLASALRGADATIASANDLIVKISPKVDTIASNVQTSTGKVDRLLERVDEATSRMNKLLQNLDEMLAENRPQVKKDLEAIETTLADARKLLTDASTMLDANRGDIDTMVEEFRRSSENLREFTDTIKQRPFSLVRVKAKPDRKVPK